MLKTVTQCATIKNTNTFFNCLDINTSYSQEVHVYVHRTIELRIAKVKKCLLLNYIDKCPKSMLWDITEVFSYPFACNPVLKFHVESVQNKNNTQHVTDAILPFCRCSLKDKKNLLLHSYPHMSKTQNTLPNTTRKLLIEP